MTLILVSSIILLIVTSFIWSRFEDVEDKNAMRMMELETRIRDEKSTAIDSEIMAEIVRLRDSIASLSSFQRELSDKQEMSSRETAFVLEQLQKSFSMFEQEGALTGKDGAELSRLDAEKILSIYKEVSSEFAHSMRSHLASVGTAIENLLNTLPSILKGASANETNKELFDYLENASISLDIMRSILRQGAGFVPLGPEDIDFSVLLRKAERICRETTGSKAEIVPTIKLPSFRSYWLNLHIALVQVLENAMEASPDTGKIEVSCRRAKSGDIWIDVSNRGEPLSAEVQKKIFKGFSTKGEGHGIGLCMAKRVLEVIDGSIALISKPDSQVITFRIALKPLKEEPNRRFPHAS
jgi:signal transduction histidine kinase